MTTIYLIVSEGQGGTLVTAYATKDDRDAAYTTLIETNYGETFQTADEAWDYMDARSSETGWNCYTTDTFLYGEDK